jgi:adenosine deaminase
VYARQVVLDWISQGVFYAELKTSPDGFINPEIRFEYPSVVRCLLNSFSQAQSEAVSEFRKGCAVALNDDSSSSGKTWAGDILGERYAKARLREVFRGTPGPKSDHGESQAPQRLPCKASLLFVGKRHKSLREMILEAAGAAVMRPAGERPTATAYNFITEEFENCRVVGFDLAGPEVGFPPARYADEFGRLSRLHVPITVHAGENAPAEFIEDAILELGALRIGHGLSLVEDKRLMARVRDERVGIELCPVCNHQTSQFHSPAERGIAKRRLYPLAEFYNAGIYVSINTDNPIISNTNMVKEYFQASYAFGEDGLSLWEALRMIRMGYVSSFLNLHERRHMLAIVEQHLFDLFSDAVVVDLLRRLCDPTMSI